MAKIVKIYDVGIGGFPVKLRVAIDDGVAVMISNYGKQLYEIYLKAKQDGKIVEFNQRNQAMVELFPDKKAEDIVKLLDADFLTAKKEQKKAQAYAKEKKK